MKIDQCDILGSGAEGVREDVLALDQRYRNTSGCAEFGVFLYEGAGDVALRARGASVSEMVIAATALSASDRGLTVLVLSIGENGDPIGTVLMLGNPFGLAEFWAYKGGAAYDTIVAVLYSAKNASEMLVTMNAAPLTEH